MRGADRAEAKSMGEVAYDRFMEALFSRRLLPGAFLSQHDLVEMLGVPVGPLRDALRVLQTEGLVTIRARSGIEVVKPDLAMAKNTYQIRGILEEAAVRLYAETAPVAAIAAMEGRHTALIGSFEGKEPSPDDIREMEALDRDFHFEIVAALRNPMVDDTYRRIHAILNLILLERPFSGPVMARTLREHLRILAACKARDADAAQKALADHFSEALKRAMALF
ncbi:MAG TPA: GntR family transcriptional regulator [Bauldia sp.]|nr:GntR family transcriptional regulator [Bauldia sp.]